jgi:hypothetical protein
VVLHDFTSALYLGLRHGSDELRPWAQLTLGAPAALREEPLARAVASGVAELVGCEAGVAGASTLHVALDLGALAARERVALFVDAGSYAIQRWGAERASALGVPVTRFAEHDVGALARALRQGAAAGRRPVVIADGFCPACGELAPLPEYLQLARSRGGPNRRRRHEGRQRRDGAQVGEQLEAAAQREQRLLRANLGVGVVPARPADGAEEHGVARPDRLEVLGPEGRAIGVDGRPAGDHVQPIDREPVARRDGVEHPAPGRHHLGAHPVAPDRRDPVACHRRYGSSVVRGPT